MLKNIVCVIILVLVIYFIFLSNQIISKESFENSNKQVIGDVYNDTHEYSLKNETINQDVSNCVKKSSYNCLGFDQYGNSCNINLLDGKCIPTNAYFNSIDEPSNLHYDNKIPVEEIRENKKINRRLSVNQNYLNSERPIRPIIDNIPLNIDTSQNNRNKKKNNSSNQNPAKVARTPRTQIAENTPDVYCSSLQISDCEGSFQGEIPCYIQQNSVCNPVGPISAPVGCEGENCLPPIGSRCSDKGLDDCRGSDAFGNTCGVITSSACKASLY